MSRTVTVTVATADITPPVITLSGNAQETINQGASYTDAGAMANDNVDGNITSNIIPTITDASGNTIVAIDANTPVGTYTITYNVMDVAGNAATPMTRTVTVTVATADTTPPVITLSGNAQETINQGASYTDAGAMANDNVDGNITSNIIPTITDASGNTIVAIDANTPVGTYTITYNVMDVAGNAATPMTRTVTVTVATADITPPVITLSGNAQETINQGASYTDAGAMANDNVDGNITSNIIPTITDASGNTVVAIDANTPVGTYTITYNVMDVAGNTATPMTRTVTVTVATADTTPPVITLSGNAQETINQGASYTDAGAMANDNLDGNITSNIIPTITDASGNTIAAIEKPSIREPLIPMREPWPTIIWMEILPAILYLRSLMPVAIP